MAALLAVIADVFGLWAAPSLGVEALASLVAGHLNHQP